LAILLMAAGLAAWAGCQKGGGAKGPDAGGSGGAPAAAEGSGSPAGGKPSGPETVPLGPPPTDEQVLPAMVAAYKNAKGYFDKGTIRIRATENGQPVDQTVEYSVAVVRPNKLRLSVYRGAVVCDGKDYWSYAQHLPGEVVKRPAPQQITLRSLFEDEILADAISQGPTLGFSAVPIQLLLLLADDPLKTILNASQPPKLLPPEKIGDQQCYRVQLERPDGKAVLWIDRQSCVLRRVELPIVEINRGAREENAEVHSVVADFSEARFDAPAGDSAFQFEMPPNAQTLDYLAMPTVLLLGKPVPEFSFTGLDGKKIDPKSLAGKVVAISFWATTCDPCRIGLPMLEKIARKYKDNDKIAFLAVSVDKPDVPNKDLQAKFADLGVTLPILRDPQEDAGRKLALEMIPALCLLGPSGVVQDYQVGIPVGFEADVSKKLEALLAGQDVFKEPHRLLAEERTKYWAVLDKWIEKGLFMAPPPVDMPETKIADASQPKNLKLLPAWKSTDVKEPGNMLVVAPRGSPPRLFVLESWKTVVEVAADGKTLARHPLQIAPEEVATFLRTATDRSGKRYFAVSGTAQQRVHLFDENWKPLMHYPEKALEKGQSHAGIADVQFADLDGDGNLELVVSYFKDVGVHAVSLKGDRLAANRSLTNVRRVAVLGPDSQGRRAVLCNDGGFGTLVTLDSQLNRLGQIDVPGRIFTWIVAEDLDGDGKPELCGLHFVDPSTQVAVGVGVGVQGGELWTYPLPKGAFEWSPEQIVAGNVLGDGPGQWLLPGPDGSIHVLAADGTPIDQFNCGASLGGLATLVADGRPLLVVATTSLLEAWEVQRPAKGPAQK